MLKQFWSRNFAQIEAISAVMVHYAKLPDKSNVLELAPLSKRNAKQKVFRLYFSPAILRATQQV